MTVASFDIKALSRKSLSFAKDGAGNIAMMFALLIVPILGLVGAAIDFSNAYRTRLNLQEALDATSLAVNRSIGELSDTDLRKLAEDMFASNFGDDGNASLSNVDIEATDRKVTLQARIEIPTIFMSLFGVDTMNIGASSTTVTGTRRFEIAMVLDNSGSMSGSKIRDLREAAENLVDVVFSGQSVSDAAKVGIVPFAASVNVGPQYRNAAWMDSTGVSPVHSENFSEPANRFELYDKFSNASWAGCVELRPYPLDVEDTAPTSSDPASYFVPMFAPDEPDDERDAENSYLDDDPTNSSGGGRCRRRRCSGSSGMSWDEAQMNVEKYYDGVRVESGNGPNYNCTTSPITPLTNSKNEIKAALDHMDANGMTNIQQGVMWGWRVVSRDPPFTQGVVKGDRNWIKAIVLMTDGANTHRGINSPNMSMYSAYGYARNGRLGTTTSNTNTLVERMNERTLEACDNAKADGILIYTVAFGVEDDVTRSLLRDCASQSDMAFTPANGSDLVATFNQIGVDLSSLRILK